MGNCEEMAPVNIIWDVKREYNGGRVLRIYKLPVIQ